jgi:hypothetical protein
VFRSFLSRRILPLALLPAVLAGASSAFGQVLLQADPSELGIEIPKADPLPAAGRRVLVITDEEQLVVANVLVEVGDRFLVVMPDGRLQSIRSSSVTITDRPFVPVTVKELSEKLQAKFPGFKVKATQHFIYVYNTSALFHLGTSQILESLYPGLVNFMKARQIPVTDSPYPLVVVMFKTRQEWINYMHGMFADTSVAAFYDGVSNRVLMYEQSELGENAPMLALKECISTVAHEGVHQILHNIGVQQRLSRWPMWISEGLPEYFSPTSVGGTTRWLGAGQVNDLRMLSIDPVLKGGLPEGSSHEALIDDLIFNDTLDSDGYAWAWGLSHYLGEKKREDFFKYVAEVSKLGPLETLKTAQQNELFASHFGSDRAKVGTDMLAHLKKLPYRDPIENMKHYVVMYRYQDAFKIYYGYAVTTSPTEIVKKREELRAKINPYFQKTAVFEVKTFPTRTKAITFAQSLK